MTQFYIPKAAYLLHILGYMFLIDKFLKFDRFTHLKFFVLTTLIFELVTITNSRFCRRYYWCVVLFQGNIRSWFKSFWLPICTDIAITILHCRFQLIDMFFQYIATRHSFLQLNGIFFFSSFVASNIFPWLLSVVKVSDYAHKILWIL